MQTFSWLSIIKLLAQLANGKIKTDTLFWSWCSKNGWFVHKTAFPIKYSLKKYFNWPILIMKNHKSDRIANFYSKQQPNISLNLFQMGMHSEWLLNYDLHSSEKLLTFIVRNCMYRQSFIEFHICSGEFALFAPEIQIVKVFSSIAYSFPTSA